MTELALDIEGMRCASCVQTIETALKRTPGVSEASVNLTLKRGRVVFDPSTIDEPKILATVRDAGFEAKPAAKLDVKTALADDAREARQERLEIGLALLTGIPVLLLDHVFMVHAGPLVWVEAVLATLTVAIAGRPFLAGAVRALRRLNANMDVLVAAGVSAALGWSWLALLRPEFRVGHLSFEAAALLVVFVRGGKLLEGRARVRAREALRALVAREAPEANVRDAQGQLRRVPTAQLVPGDVVVVATGETVPADGVIVEGSSAFDESFLTGESIPRERGPNDEVPGGAINAARSVVIRATRTGEETALRKVARLVLEAQAQKAPIQRFADAAARVFVPSVIALALVTGGAWLALGANFATALARAVAVLVVACPCALGLATPAAILVGSGVGLRRGILVRGAPALEALGRVRTLLLDKTGTLTRGAPRVVAFETRPEEEPSRVLGLLLSLEERSSHPLARAVMEHARAQGLTPQSVDDHEELAGLGVRGRVAGVDALVGRRELLVEKKVALDDELGRRADELAREGATLVHVAREGREVALVALRDEPRPEAAEAMQKLKTLGVATAVLSGDRSSAVEHVAKALGIAEAVGELSPKDKLGRIRRRQATAPDGELVAMVGDGINDAPALACADVGIALGAGADVAKEAGEVVLVRDDLRDVPTAIALGRATLAKIRQNLVLAVVYNVIGIPLAAGVLSRWGLELTPAFAGLAMALSSASVVGNALLLGRFRN